MGGLIPELSVSDWQASLRFYRDVLGFSVRYTRPEEGFAFLARGRAELMIDQIGLGRTFDGGHRPDAYPYGSGVNLQIEVESIAPLLAALEREGRPFFLPPEERWYRRNEVEVGNRQFVVADPDGFLLRFFEDLGARPLLEAWSTKRVGTWSVCDVEVPGNAVEYVRRRPKRFLPRGLARPDLLAARMVSMLADFAVLPATVDRDGDWWIVTAARDWMPVAAAWARNHMGAAIREEYGSISVAETFNRLLPVPGEANGSRPEILLTAFAEAVVTAGPDGVEWIAGEGTFGAPKLDTPEGGRAVAFHLCLPRDDAGEPG